MIIVNLAVVLYVGVTAVLVILHEGDPGPLYLASHTELPLLVSPNPREISAVSTVLDGQCEIRLAKWKGSLVPAAKLEGRFNEIQ